MNQPSRYKDEPHLIEWLKKDLKRQRDEGIAEENLMLNIGNIDNIDNTDNIELIQNFQYDKFIETEINFCFHFKDILKELLKLENKEPKYDEKNIICYYRLNAISVTFSKEAYFNYSTFSKETYFVTSVFSGNANFNDSAFTGNANFYRSTFSGEITFYNIQFKENENSKIEIINTIINGRVDFNNVLISELNLEGSNIVGILNRINFEAYPSNSDTACILKNEELKKNNTIKALKFKAIEKDLYTEELKNKKDKTPENWTEIASLKISKISNNHGQNWFRAVVFTLLSGVLFFTLTIIPISITKYLYILLAIYFTAFIFEDIWKYLINTILIYMILFWFVPFLYETLPYMHKIIYNYADFSITDFFAYFVPTNFDPIIPSKNDTLLKCANGVEKAFSYTTYIMGKIAIGYGIVEIVQAFRKLNSKV